MGSDDRNVWLITGCSSGFGKAIAEAALERGDTVVATARNITAFEGLEQKGALVRRLDVTAPDDQIAETISEIVSTVGRIDILVNNAGYILTGAIEEVR
jgi:NAD(P)-dependent dehydrogenase (short-subunit alcohol dehydrogenase family)